MTDQFARLADDDPPWGPAALRILCDVLNNSLLNLVAEDPNDETGRWQLADMDLWHSIVLTSDEHAMLTRLAEMMPTRECVRHGESGS